MLAVAAIVQSLSHAMKPWESLYSDSRAVSSAVTFVHLAGLMFAGGLAVTSDRATFRAFRGTDEDRRRLLVDLGNAHRWVLGGLAVIAASGVLQFLSDVKTFATSPTYWIKMGLVILLLANGAVLQRTERKLRAEGLLADSDAPINRHWRRLRFTAATSMVLWTAIVLAGVILLQSS